MVEGDAAITLGEMVELEGPGVIETDQSGNEDEGVALTLIGMVQGNMSDIDTGHGSSPCRR